MNRLKEPSGKQDEYVASLGGIRAYDVGTKGDVKVHDLNLSDEDHSGNGKRHNDVLHRDQEKRD